jgi:hypothetical protein
MRNISVTNYCNHLALSRNILQDEMEQALDEAVSSLSYGYCHYDGKRDEGLTFKG